MPRDTTSQTTYRYLRLALVVLVVLLGAAVVVEWAATGWSCLQPSISGYWYTPARPVLVGTLVAVGVCLVALKGSDDLEDVLLNLAGAVAPVIAFVPTPDRDTCSSVPVPVGTIETAASVDNSTVALLVAGGLAVLLTAAAVARRPGRARAQVLGTGVSALVLVAGAGWFVLDREGFRAGAHNTAAVLLFVVFVAVVWLNARDLDRCRGRGEQGMWLGLRTRYAVVAVLMVVVPALMFGYAWLVGWAQVLLGVEAALIGLFAVFWVLQTAELGDLSGRVRPASSPARSPAPSR